MPLTAGNAATLALFGLGYWEIVIVLVVILLLFGGRKLPELARGLGRGLRIFKNEVKGVKTDVEDAVKEDDAESGQAAGDETPKADA